MKKIFRQLVLFVFPLLAISLGAFFYYSDFVSAASTAVVQVTIKIEICGDGVKDGGEECDGSDLNGRVCSSFSGFTGGTLLCTSGCLFNTDSCTAGAGVSPPAGGGGGGGGGAQVVTSVVFVGRAYPGSAVMLLKDAAMAASTMAGADANFQITLSGISSGSYIFSLYSEDSHGRRSSLLTFPVSIISGATTRVSGIFIAPTIAVDKSAVKRGDNLIIFGQSAPQSDITIQVNSEQEFFAKTKSDQSGAYLYNLDTAFLENGEHWTKSKAARNDEISAFSQAVNFKVGDKTVVEDIIPTCQKADFNCDDRVNLVDFSVVAYWYKRSASPERYDLNGDGKIDLVDFSIMAYYWTG